MTVIFRRAVGVLLLAITGVAFAHHNGNLYFDGEITVEPKNATVVSLVMVNPLSALTPGIFRSIFQTESSVEQVEAEMPEVTNTAEQP